MARNIIAVLADAAGDRDKTWAALDIDRPTVPGQDDMFDVTEFEAPKPPAPLSLFDV